MNQRIVSYSYIGLERNIKDIMWDVLGNLIISSITKTVLEVQTSSPFNLRKRVENLRLIKRSIKPIQQIIADT